MLGLVGLALLWWAAVMVWNGPFLDVGGLGSSETEDSNFRLRVVTTTASTWPAEHFRHLSRADAGFGFWKRRRIKVLRAFTGSLIREQLAEGK